MGVVTQETPTKARHPRAYFLSLPLGISTISWKKISLFRKLSRSSFALVQEKVDMSNDVQVSRCKAPGAIRPTVILPYAENYSAACIVRLNYSHDNRNLPFLKNQLKIRSQRKESTVGRSLCRLRNIFGHLNRTLTLSRGCSSQLNFLVQKVYTEEFFLAEATSDVTVLSTNATELNAAVQYIARTKFTPVQAVYLKRTDLQLLDRFYA
ncbi:uncharacterized protein LOC112589917 [Harpegnathos saltator]|uniref:uncharacterized protein LOC112589917 n=1 Tax=Harpegnathos saltator TaxID=610380 RepID=UPI000DBED005|nr:uncharacterized protein LOC112589917 [Harpegnathos saltator]